MHLRSSQPYGSEPFVASCDPSADPAGLGLRMIGSDAVTGELLDVIRVTPDLGRPATVEMAVRERAKRFDTATLPGLAPLVRVHRSSADGRLEVWSRRAEGFRLSAVLEWTETRGVGASLDAALTVGDRLLSALASLQRVENVSGASGHGAIAVDQVLVSETGALTLTDYGFGTALAGLQWTREALWRRFRIAMPPAAGLARFDHRVDVTQAAVVLCALLCGRLLRADEYPRDLDAIVSEAVLRSCADAPREDRERLTAWLRGATELESRNAFQSAGAARLALHEALGHRIGDDEAVQAWLRAARGIVMPESPAAGPVAADVPAVMEAQVVNQPQEAEAVIAAQAPLDGGVGARVRRWLRGR
ncbi:MAG: hypothetical protein M3R55_02630 [Acidobacteriota bacterium]|nr:hypothetical protein [Acidobacteriota bacterium]